MDFTPPFNRWLKERRKQLDLTQGDLARRVGYSPETIRKIEAGAMRPSRQIVDLLADHLGVPSSQRDAFLAFATGARTANAKAKPAPTNLPTPANVLIGREKDVAAVRALLDNRSRTPQRSSTSTPTTPRLITLLGPPGVGKTRLAVEVAHQVKDAFPDGAWFVALAPVTDPQAALATILQALDAPPAPGLLPLDALMRHLRERELLLVLDNLEQVLDVAPFIAELLGAAPKSRILATSREPLRIAAEQRVAVQPLPTDPAAALFVQRARAVQPDFMPTPEVGAICAKLDGLPLAIEMAAARIEAFTPQELLARLDKRLRTLTTGGRDMPARQQTLRATIDWSYQLLTPDEQAFLRRMGVFAGGFTLHAAQVFCEIDGLPLRGEDGIAALVSKSLLVHEPQADGSSSYWFNWPTASDSLLNRRESHADGESRYRLLETIREYALDRLDEQGERIVWQRRHAEYFVAIWAARNEPMPLERDNLRTALEWTRTARDAGGLGLLLAPSSASAFEWREAAAWLEQVVMHPDAHRYSAAHAEALRNLGVLLSFLGDSRRALAMHQASLSICRAHDFRFLIAQVLYCFGHAAREAGDYPTARAHLEESNRWARELGASHEVDYITLAEVYVGMEDADEAERLLHQGLPLAEATHTRETFAWGLNHLAHVAQLRSEFERAKMLLTQSMRIFTDEVTDRRMLLGTAWNHQSLGEVALAQGDGAQAQAHFIESLRRFDQLGDGMGIAWCLAGLAGVAALQEEPERGTWLWGAGEELRARTVKRVSPASRPNRERTVAMLRQRWSDERFEAEQAIGRAMTIEQAVALAQAPSLTRS